MGGATINAGRGKPTLAKFKKKPKSILNTPNAQFISASEYKRQCEMVKIIENAIKNSIK